MKFEEKLMKLRKENALSQEELAEKLNVTRQTISKWELGQTKPDAEKLSEIAKLFNVSADELLNDSNDPVKSSNKNTDNSKRTVIIVLILLLALLMILGWSLYSLFFSAFKNVKEVNNEVKGVFGDIILQTKKQEKSNENFQNLYNNVLNRSMEQFNNSTNQMNEQMNTDVTKTSTAEETNSFNYFYENLYTGLKSKFFTETAIKEVIKNNINNERKITVKYKKTKAKSNKELTNLIKKLNKKEYIITYKKDADGYINQMIIKDV